jgi:LEM3 (ligand-effect modulator 3) family / CDC50 family
LVAAADSTSSPQCLIQFDIPFNISPSVLIYYKLTNFYQNHRRYVQSYDSGQLKGKHRTVNDLKNGNCKPLAVSGDQVIYPCGLIANSIFNGVAIFVIYFSPPYTTVRHV